jgi:Fe-S-cluster containining protein
MAKQSKFRCYRCGWSCRLEKYTTQEEFDLASKALSKQGIKLRGSRLTNGMILWEQPCPALKFVKGKAICLIYKVRPYPCRQFLCGRQSLEDTRPFFSDGSFNMEYYNEQLKKYPEFAKIKEKMEDKAAKWGIAHGWDLVKTKREI